MAAYPAIRYTVRSRQKLVDTLEVVRADNGTPWGYVTGPGAKAEFELDHNGINGTDLATLRAFYDANRAVGGITLVWDGDGATYTCLFAAPPDITPLGAGRWRCVMRLAQE